MWRRLVRRTLLVLAAVVLAIQVIPYGRAHVNPPVRTEPAWNSPHTRDLAVRACFDCHSNETVWPWYSRVAPVSWLVQRDVAEGRRVLNFSEWDRPQREARESPKVVGAGEMPPWYYGVPRPARALTSGERSGLVAGLEATLGMAQNRTGRGRGHGPVGMPTD
jgi:hypothetical protein